MGGKAGVENDEIREVEDTARKARGKELTGEEVEKKLGSIRDQITKLQERENFREEKRSKDSEFVRATSSFRSNPTEAFLPSRRVQCECSVPCQIPATALDLDRTVAVQPSFKSNIHWRDSSTDTSP